MIQCHLCDEKIEGASIPDYDEHLRVLHPKEYAEVERWPDGKPVVHDDTLEPKEFSDDKPVEP